MAGRAWARPAFGRQTPKGLVSIRSFLLLLLLPPPPAPSCCPALLCFIPSHRHCLSVCPSPSNISLHFGSSSLFESSRLFHFPQPVLLLALMLPNLSLYVFALSSFLLFPLRSGLEWSLDSSFHWGHFSISTASVNITNTSKYKTLYFLFFYHHPKTWLCPIYSDIDGSITVKKLDVQQSWEKSFWTPHSVIFVQSPTLTHILQVHYYARLRTGCFHKMASLATQQIQEHQN